MRTLQQHPAPGNFSSWAEVPAAVRARLEAEDVRTLADWHALGRRRFELFGITRAMATQLDALLAGGTA
jgi:hypothetical protein